MAVEKQATTGIFRPMSLDRTLLAAQGYIELDMPVDALAELDALGSTSDAKLLAARSGKGASDGNEAVAVSIVFDDGENLIFAWQ